ncbi:hypothetical protein E5288_WYG018872 [Bos mutus]|uniref:PHD-type domain-containing protein n=1 Tax=Bos mutus TaxID=72004 RepID=A0A6B0R284_9CETA|nr:hypothetical protein [Bos mutus]
MSLRRRRTRFFSFNFFNKFYAALIQRNNLITGSREHPLVCRLCLQEPGDPEKLGEFLQKDNLSVHYFCLILSSKLPQRGQSNRGFHGFLPEDIRKEAARASRKICFVCKRKGAAINCQKDQCARNFHLPCGLERGCLSQFFGEYKKWRLILCATCGSHGTHRNCSSLRSNCKKWECMECAPAAKVIEQEVVMRNSTPIGPDPRDIASAPCVLPDCLQVVWKTPALSSPALRGGDDIKNNGNYEKCALKTEKPRGPSRQMNTKIEFTHRGISRSE